MAEAHLVQELLFEVEFASAEQAWEEQERLCAFVQGPALRIVEEAFERHGRENGDAEVLRLDALELDLGEVDVADLEAQWTQRLQAQLQEALATLRARRRAAVPAVSLLAGADPADHGATETRLTRSEAELQALLHFLVHGRLPWSVSPHADPVALGERVWQHSAGQLLVLLRALPQPQPALRRLVRQFPPAWLQRLDSGLRAQNVEVEPTPTLLPWAAGLSLGPSAAPAAARVSTQTAARAAAECRLLAALQVPAAGPPGSVSQGPSWAADPGHPGQAAAWSVATAARQPSAPLRAALRRFKALLVDDAPRLSTDDTLELLNLWQQLRLDDAAGLRQLLAALGVQARVRRRMVSLWPQNLLLQLPSLWLGSEDSAAVLAGVRRAQQGLADRAGSSSSSADGLREPWALVLRHLWADGGIGRMTAGRLLSALQAWPAKTEPEAAPQARPWPAGPLQQTVPEAAWLASLLGLDPVAAAAALASPASARSALRAAAATWAQQRVLAAALAPGELARCLAWWLPNAQAEALADLAYGALPRAWQHQPADGAEPLDASRRVQSCLQALVNAPAGGLRAEDIAAAWWRALALQQQRSPHELRFALRPRPSAGGGTTQSGASGNPEAADRLRRAAWLRWLPRTPALAEGAGQGGDAAAAGAAWSAACAEDAAGLRAWLLGSGARTGEVAARPARAARWPDGRWREALALFIGTTPAQALDEGLTLLARAGGRLLAAAPPARPGSPTRVHDDPAVASTGWPDPALIRLRVHALALLATGADADHGAPGALSTLRAALHRWARVRGLTVPALALQAAALAGTPETSARFVEWAHEPAAEAAPAMAAALAAGDWAALSALLAGLDGLPAPATQALQAVLRAHSRQATLRRRLAADCPQPLWQRLLALLIPAEAVAQVEPGLQALATTAGDTAGTALRLRADLLAWAANTGQQPPQAMARAALAHLLQRQSRRLGSSPAVLARALVQTGRAAPPLAEWLERGQVDDTAVLRRWRAALRAGDAATPSTAKAGASVAAGRSGADGSEGRTTATGWPDWLALPPAQAWARWRQLRREGASGGALAGALTSDAQTALLALFLPAADGLALSRHMQGLQRALQAGSRFAAHREAGGVQARHFIAEALLTGLLSARPDARALQDRLLSRVAEAVGMSPDSLAKQLQAGGDTGLGRDGTASRHEPDAAAPGAAPGAVPSAAPGRAPVQAVGASAAERPAPLDLPPAQAVAALRRLGRDSSALNTWAQALAPAALPEVLALFLPASAVHHFTRLLAALGDDPASGGAGPGSPEPPEALTPAARLAATLRAHLLKALLWTASPDVQGLTGQLLELAAWQLRLPVPLLARRLQKQWKAAASRPAPSPPSAHTPAETMPGPKPTSTAEEVDGVQLLQHWAAERRPVDLDRAAEPGRWPGEPAARTGRLAPADGPSAPSDPAPTEPAASNEAVAVLVQHLRGVGPDTGDPGALQARWLALTLRPHHPARARLARELESAPAAQRLSQALAPHALLRVLGWLRPADAATLAAVWPGLQALTPDWPPVARAVLRELFEEDRALDPNGLLQRTEAALRRSAARNPAAALPPAGAAAATRSTPWLFDTAPHEPLFITNAGLVLAGPYLPRLFGMLGLAVDQRFVDEAAAERAVLLTQYAVTGQAQAAEPLLLLNKLLCGVQPQMPVAREIEPTATECQAVDGMLLAMIGHWKALGQTSLAGLRQTYLQREGRLEHRDEAWQLQVQPNTFDVLLDRLPWGYATLKFPWMPEVLHVDWR